MTNLYSESPDQTGLVAEVIKVTHSGHTGLATNIDGTISRLVTTPEEAEVSPACREALDRLSESGSFAVIAVISGRSAIESRRLVGLDRLHYIGNNGLEILAPGRPAAQPVKAARPYLSLIKTVLETIEHTLANFQSEQLAATEGTGWFDNLIFENKGLAASVHYRRFASDKLIKPLLLEKIGVIAGEVGLRVEETSKAVEIRPPVKVNKSTALTDLSESYRLNHLIYLGSEAGDLEAFHALKRLAQEHHRVRQEVILDYPEFNGLNVAVRNPETPPELVTAADYRLEGVPGVEKFLAELADNLKEG